VKERRQSRLTARRRSDVTSAVRADARLTIDEFRAIGARHKSLGSRDSVNFLPPGLPNSEDDHPEDPENRAEYERTAGIAALVFPESHSDEPGQKVLDEDELDEKEAANVNRAYMHAGNTPLIPGPMYTPDAARASRREAASERS
jgi:hypothetical protein